MHMDESAKKFNPKPEQIKTIVIVDVDGRVQTYSTIFDVITAVYRIPAPVRDHIAEIIFRASELNQKQQLKS